MPKRLSQEEQDNIVDMFLAGMDLWQIADETGRSIGAIRIVTNKYKRTHPEYSKPRLDEGKIRALYEAHLRGSASWPPEKIALECGCTLEEVQAVIDKTFER